MKHVILGALITTFAARALATDVGVSVSIGQPGFYGRIDLGNMPQPQLIYPTPVLIQQPVGVAYSPVYLRVPPGHEKKWGKHCHKYNACGRPVYFVQDNWYTNVYAPRYYDDHGGGKGNNGNKGKGKGKGHGHD